MEQAHQIALLRRLSDLVARRSTTRADAPSSVPVEHYTSPERLDQEGRSRVHPDPMTLEEWADVDEDEPGETSWTACSEAVLCASRR